ncbi:hypothetical protein [Pseudogulbenkiania sp. NH8B]|uniref:hypothetical protein n=1 Tax=Pseudogulbenkiania sp. (strain NH8B) TaxID=748280 RepID=UPI0011D29E7C|nr:hypothetical protein [Pseudogulbenkiania sp. NH8B]
MNQTSPATLLAVAKVYWRHFAPAWMLPIVLLPVDALSARLGHPLLFFWLIVMPLFFWGIFRGARPWLEHKIKYWHCVFWIMVFPFLIWVVVVVCWNAW